MADPWLVLGALACESVCGYPAWLDRRVPHPVRWIGAVINRADRTWNTDDYTATQRRMLGVATLVIVTGAALALGRLLDVAGSGRAWWVTLWVVAATLGLAQRSLHAHVAEVQQALEKDDLPGARTAVARIVGRDVEALDERGIAAAALESLAESFNDGIVAPAFWLALGGLGGLFAYKAVNTADSMIGHIEPRWRSFGWAAARCDDAMNYLPARIAGALLVAAGGGWSVMVRDAGKHASPNAGWPEAAMAGGLRLRLGGGLASYDGVIHARPTFGDGPIPDVVDLRRGLKLYLVACGLLWSTFAIGGVLWRL